MSEANSPYYKAGCADGERDTQLVTDCPPGDPIGMDPDRAWSWMYRRGYEASFKPVRHECDESCTAR